MATKLAQILKALRGAYPEKTIPDQTVEVYMRCLADLPLPALEAAVLNHIASSKWFPTIAELREKALALLPGQRMPTATEAWAEVMRAFEMVGYYGTPEWSHEAIARTVAAMGWQNLCLSENGMADRAHFLRLYEVYCKRLREDQLMLPEARRLAAQLEEPKELNGAIKMLADRYGARIELPLAGEQPETTQ